MQFVPLVLFVAVHLKNCFLLPSCHLTLMSFSTQGLPELQNPLFQKAKENLLPGEKVPFRAEEVSEIVFLSVPHPSSGTVSPLPEVEVNFLDDGFCDFTFRLSAE